MDKYNFLKNELIRTGQSLSALLSEAKAAPGMHDSLKGWEKTCEDIRRHLAEDIIRVAVVGSIKSGKSTFVNSLFKGDYLKRGAGVVTSIVTKIRRGTALEATLCFKSWDEVNTDMRQAALLLPALGDSSDREGFDIRKDADRENLRQGLERLDSELLITNDTRNLNSVLLESYLDGYPRVADIVGADSEIRTFAAGRFGAHRDFVGNDALSVYLRDVRLEINTGADIDGAVEIADCQGSDSPNPLHLAMIQDYLLGTHLIVYVITSRTGLRQADIKFLSIIRKMGIMDNVLFVFNFDFNEHESLEELHALRKRAKTEISLIKPHPEVFTLSALFNLFKSDNIRLSEKDRQRLGQWKKEKPFVAFSDEETKRFLSCFERKLTGERCALLFGNHLERLSLISSGAAHRLRLAADILSGDARDTEAMLGSVEIHRKKMGQIRSMTESTLDGTLRKMRATLRADVDRFFDRKSDRILGQTLKFVRNYDAPLYKYEESAVPSDFSNRLYLIFQEFKGAVDMFMAEDVNPEIIRFVRNRERLIREELEAVVGPYQAMSETALAEYNRGMARFGIPPVTEGQQGIELPDTETLKRGAGLKLPPLSAPMRYSARIKTEAIMRFSLHSAFRVFRKMLKLSPGEEDRGMSALRNGVSQMKKETEGAVLFHFKDYRENIKFQYLFRLLELFSDVLRDLLHNRFQAYVGDLSEIARLVGEKREDREKAREMLEGMGATAARIREKTDGLRAEIMEGL